jgi:ATP-dependent helicase/nuclease subunit A
MRAKGAMAMAMPRAYDSNGAAVDAKHFIEIACDPMRSVVVEACAGSGKTWLLVARMLRLLLSGAAPSELLAITFTRKAAQEMRERLMQLLQDLALKPDSEVAALLRERGIAAGDTASLLPVARGLLERVLTSPSALSIDTFHSWFARLIQIAPLASGTPHGYGLTESSGELLTEAYSRLMQEIGEEGDKGDEVNEGDEERVGIKASLKQSLLRLYALAGDWNTKKMLDAFIGKRAEWWAANQRGLPLEQLAELCGEDGRWDARLRLWDDARLMERLRSMAWLLGQGAKRNQDRATAIESALTAGASLSEFAQLLDQFCDDKGKPRSNNQRSGKLLGVLEQNLGEAAADVFEREFAAIGGELLQLQRRSGEPTVLALNQALFTVGSAYLAHYQEIKAEQRVFDFADLEWQAYRLLIDETHAAYIQSRLDSRYKHILLDEFQDTNPLQWSIVRAWLNAYGDDGTRPSVFIVGDPKQSIYRFRRADPRVFQAASDMLAARGADVLRTNQTRRNAQAIIDVLNASLTGNRIFSPQTTLADQQGAVWRLPLIRISQENQENPAESAQFILRDPLATPREEQEDARRFEEGRAVAAAIIDARRALESRSESAVSWSDVMLLVKKRVHLRAYESALREAGIPFISDKRGGLLESLEVADLIALLTFLITPGDNLALAHVLKSPIVGADDSDLIMLAGRTESIWWLRLKAVVQEQPSEALRRAARLLECWLRAAPQLPVHDLLDLILHQGQLQVRYAQAASSMARSQVLGNIDAFIELSLSLDAGRYPSLPKFIAALQALRKGADNDAPDEASIDAAIDAVRVLTIHSAKGLEAPIVVLLDANHSEPARDDSGVLCDWPQDADAPTHFSVFGRKDERGTARDFLFREEEQFKAQEDWNLLYVAATRAKQILIVSGVAGARNANAEGVVEDSWYARLHIAPERQVDDVTERQAVGDELPFTLPIFEPPPLPANMPETPEMPPPLHSDAIDEGILLHALLERLTHGPAWPIRVPDADAVAQWLVCSRTLAATVGEQARAILTDPKLERFFNPAFYRSAHNEMEVAIDGKFLRYDRVVVFDAEIWILDYKRQLLDNERAAYHAQLALYRQAGQAVFPGGGVRTALITVDGRLWEF